MSVPEANQPVDRTAVSGSGFQGSRDGQVVHTGPARPDNGVTKKLRQRFALHQGPGNLGHTKLEGLLAILRRHGYHYPEQTISSGEPSGSNKNSTMHPQPKLVGHTIGNYLVLPIPHNRGPVACHQRGVMTDIISIYLSSEEVADLEQAVLKYLWPKKIPAKSVTICTIINEVFVNIKLVAEALNFTNLSSPFWRQTLAEIGSFCRIYHHVVFAAVVCDVSHASVGESDNAFMPVVIEKVNAYRPWAPGQFEAPLPPTDVNGDFVFDFTPNLIQKGYRPRFILNPDFIAGPNWKPHFMALLMDNPVGWWDWRGYCGCENLYKVTQPVYVHPLNIELEPFTVRPANLRKHDKSHRHDPLPRNLGQRANSTQQANTTLQRNIFPPQQSIVPQPNAVLPPNGLPLQYITSQQTVVAQPLSAPGNNTVGGYNNVTAQPPFASGNSPTGGYNNGVAQPSAPGNSTVSGYNTMTAESGNTVMGNTGMPNGEYQFVHAAPDAQGNFHPSPPISDNASLLSEMPTFDSGYLSGRTSGVPSGTGSPELGQQGNAMVID